MTAAGATVEEENSNYSLTDSCIREGSRTLSLALCVNHDASPHQRANEDQTDMKNM